MKKYFPALFALIFFGCQQAEKKTVDSKAATDSSMISQTRPAAPEARIVNLKNVVMTYKGDGRSTQDTLQIPVVTDGHPQLQQALNAQSILGGDAMADVVANYKDCACGLTSLKTNVCYQSEDLVSMVMQTTYMGAYPSTAETLKTFEVKSGQPYPISREITSVGEDAVLKVYKAAMKIRIGQKKKTLAKEAQPDDFQTVENSIDTLTAKYLLSSFAFSKTGLILHTENVMPHVAEALEPDRHYEMPLQDLRPFKTAAALVIK